MFNFYTGLAFLGGVLTGIMLILILGHILVVKRKKEAALASSDPGKYLNKERNILGDLRRLNPERCKAFGHEVKDMDVTFWATELAGETGELCNWIKKLKRGDNIPNIKAEIAKEAGDVLCSLDLLCIWLEIDLQAATVNKFNEVSDRVNSPLKL